MSIYYNDYEQTIMTYLRKYTDWKVYLENLQEKISDLESSLALEPAPKTSQFRDTPPPSGFDAGGPQEAAVERREADLERLRKMKQDYHTLAPLLKRLDRSMDALDGVERSMVIQHGIHRLPWKNVALAEGCDESYCRRKWRDGVHRLSGMMFGPKAAPVQLRLVFYDESTNPLNIE